MRIQSSVRLNRYNEPEPDLVLLRPQADFYASRIPSAADVLLIIEVAESSLDYDREVKAELYAGAGVPEYWLADIKSGTLFAYSQIETGKYRVVRQLHRSDLQAPVLIADCPLPIDIFLPQP